MPHKKGTPATNKIDLIGKRFGRLVVVQLGEQKYFPSGSVARQWLCICDCGKQLQVLGNNLRRGNSKSCGCADIDRKRRKAQSCHNWSGGRWINKDGYVMVYITDADRKFIRSLSTTRIYELEHVLIMSKQLGRILTKEETVHHINGKRDDNRIENLELWSSSHPPGQRVVDKIKWAYEILSLYETQTTSLPSRPSKIEHSENDPSALATING